MASVYPAHLRVYRDGTVKTQSCTAHSQNAARYASEALVPNLSNSAYLAALVHDMGKWKPSFSSYLNRSVFSGDSSRGSVIHTFAGVRYLLMQYHEKVTETGYEDIVSEILAYAAGAHHGLFDCINEHHENGFLHRIQTIPPEDDEAIHNFLADCANQNELDTLFSKAVQELTPVLEKCVALTGDAPEEELYFLLGLLVRLLSSAVMEGDRRDTAEFMNDAVFPLSADIQTWKKLLERTEQKLNRLPCDTPINRARRQISDCCREAALQAPGIWRLNVPTGGGKTLASLRYALAHAAEFDKKRIIFVSPLLSILDQNSKVIREYLEADELILEHHSNVILEEKAASQQYALLADSWSSPIIITTMVQLLNTMFDGRTSSVRRFHALRNAVIVIDEIQTVPDKLLSLFHLTVSFLAEICSSTVILCSATQPCTEATDHPIRSKIGDLIPYDKTLYDVFRRTQISHRGSCKMEDIPSISAEILAAADRLLIVCNKKEEAEYLYTAMQSDTYALFHLSAAMCMKHRQDTLEKLTASLRYRSKKTVCVATQVIEAGIDISFDAVIRLTAGLDSVIQSAGRCNRNGQSEIPGQVYILRAEDETLSRLPEIKMAQQATEQLLSMYLQKPEKFDGDLSSDESVRYYYKELYKIQRRGDRYYHDFPLKAQPTLLSLLSINDAWISEKDSSAEDFVFHQAFASAGKAFSVFDNDTTDVIVPYGEGATIITDLISERAKYDITFVQERLRLAKGYTVSLYTYQKKKLEEQNALIPLAGGAMLGLASEYYNTAVGMRIHLHQEVNDLCDTQIW